MQSILCSRPIQFSSRSSLLLNSVDIVGHLRRNSFSGTKSPTFNSWPTVSFALPDQRLGIRARKKKRRSSFRRSSKLILELASIVVSNLKILPQPLDSIIRELTGSDGGGGGFGSRKGFGGGGFDGWRRRRRRRVNKNFVFVSVLIISALILLFWTDVDINGVKLLLGFLLFGIALNQWLRKRGILDLSMELCMWGLMVCLGLKRVEVRQWSERIRNAQPLKNILRRTRGKGAFWDLKISGLLTEEADDILGRADHFEEAKKLPNPLSAAAKCTKIYSEAGRLAKLDRAAVKQDKSESLSAGIQ